MTDAIKSAVTTAITNTDAPIAIKADTEWSAISTDILNAANGATGVDPDFEVVAGTTPLELNTDATPNTVTINLVVRQKNLMTNKADIAIENITLATD